MAVVWSHREGETLYEVRTAGHSIRLYRDGVFHSQYNPNRPLAGGVWDLLFIPSLFRTQGIARVLMLGVGGGAAIRLYRELLSVKEIVGVELDPLHIGIAEEHFAVTGSGIELYCADALEWLASYRGDRFDVVVEDLFTESNGEAVRVATASASWFAFLLSVLRPGGILIVNFEDTGQMRRSIANYQQAAGRSPIAYQFTQPTYGNCVCAFLSEPCRPAVLRARLDEILAGYPDARQSGQRFRVRRVV